IGVLGNAAEIVPELARRNIQVDVVTDQTSAHDPLSYVPAGVTPEDAAELRLDDPDEYVRRARASMARHVDAMVAFLDRGAEVFDYGNSLRAEARLGGCIRAFDYPGFVPAYIRPLFCEGKGPFRWVALSGEQADIAATDRAMVEEFAEDDALVRWIKAAGERVRFQGLPARICWLGYGERARAGRLFNELVRSGAVKAPIVIGRDHLDSGSVASPYRETEAMRDGSDAIADWPILNALLNTSSGASWVSVHHGGGVGIGRSHHVGGGGRFRSTGRGDPQGLDDPGPRQRPQPRVPAPAPGRDRVWRRRLLGVAGAHVPLHRVGRGRLLQARPPCLPRDAPGRHHRRRRVPLPPRPWQRAGGGPDRRRRRGGDQDHADRRLLPARRHGRPAPRAGADLLQRR